MEKRSVCFQRYVAVLTKNIANSYSQRHPLTLELFVLFVKKHQI